MSMNEILISQTIFSKKRKYENNDNVLTKKLCKEINKSSQDDFSIDYQPPDDELWRIIPSMPEYEMNAIGIVRERKWKCTIKTSKAHQIDIGGKSNRRIKSTKNWFIEVFP